MWDFRLKERISPKNADLCLEYIFKMQIVVPIDIC